MLIWLATFFAVSLVLVFAIRLSLSRVRKRRAEQLKAIETRCREVPEDLGLPLIWRTSPKTSDAADYQWVQTFQWTLPLGLLAAGVMWSATGQNGWNWNGAGFGLAVAVLSFLAFTVWLSWRRQTTIPTQTRRLALALRCWAIRMNAGIECRMALEKTAKQLRRLDPELARHLEAGAAARADGDLLQRAFYPCGTGVADRLADVIAGIVSDAPAALRELADRLDGYYLNQVLARTRLIDGWLKYPIGLCLVPAVNLMLFGPAITDLLEKFGTVRFPVPRQVQPLDELHPVPEPEPAIVPDKDAV
ncbi:MAG: hypothetical protein JWN70_2364 [Planctomycetaceae bacterium]|nr:hypothetical protein [Planctomycetaceae bacterium]